MKIAVFHDYFRVIGGAEKLALTLAKALKADVITSEFDTKVIKEAGFKGIKIIALGKKTDFSYFLSNVCVKRFSECDFSQKYDFFIFSGNFAMYAAKKHRPNLWYCHTPLRGLYESQMSDKTTYSRIVDAKKKVMKRRIVPKFIGYYIDGFFNNIYIVFLVSSETVKKRGLYILFPFYILRMFFRVLFLSFSLYKYNITKSKEREMIQDVDEIITNSLNVKNRITRFYKRNSQVVNPPIATKTYRFAKNGNFWLSVNRLTPQKRIEMQVDAFRKLPGEKLIIVGGFDNHNLRYVTDLKNGGIKNVSFFGSVSNRKLIELYANCKGFITTAMDEDFGMNVVEAMASGKPVIAPEDGGYKESIIHGKTGALINDITEEKIVSAIKTIGNNPKRYKNACLEQAKKFDKKIFINKIKRMMVSESGRRTF